MVSSKKPGKQKKRVVVDIPRDLWVLTKEDKAQLRRKLKAVLVEVRGAAAEGGDDDEGDLTPITENT